MLYPFRLLMLCEQIFSHSRFCVYIMKKKHFQYIGVLNVSWTVKIVFSIYYENMHDKENRAIARQQHLGRAAQLTFYQLLKKENNRRGNHYIVYLLFSLANMKHYFQVSYSHFHYLNKITSTHIPRQATYHTRASHLLVPSNQSPPQSVGCHQTSVQNQQSTAYA